MSTTNESDENKNNGIENDVPEMRQSRRNNNNNFRDSQRLSSLLKKTNPEQWWLGAVIPVVIVLGLLTSLLQQDFLIWLFNGAVVLSLLIVAWFLAVFWEKISNMESQQPALTVDQPVSNETKAPVIHQEQEDFSDKIKTEVENLRKEFENTIQSLENELKTVKSKLKIELEKQEKYFQTEIAQIRQDEQQSKLATIPAAPTVADVQLKPTEVVVIKTIEPPFKLPPTSDMLSSQETYQWLGLSPILPSEFGFYPTIDWYTLGGTKDYQNEWANILTKDNRARLYFPPIMLPTEMGGWMFLLYILWVEDKLTLWGEIVIDDKRNRTAPLPIQVHLSIALSLANDETFTTDQVFQIVKGRNPLWTINSQLNSSWTFPTAKVQVFNN